MQAAKPVAAPDRDAFLRDIAAELGKHEVPRRDSAGTLDSFWRADRILRRGEGLARRAKLTSAGGRWNYSAKVIYGLQPLADAQWGLHSTGRRNRVRPWVCWERRRRHGRPYTACALKVELASPVSRNRTLGHTRTRLKELAPPGCFCARMRRPLRFRNRTPSARSLRSLRPGLHRETKQS
jgi:hypothetical protein